MTDQITIIRSKDRGAKDKSLEVCLREEAVRDQSKSARDLLTSLQDELDEIEGDLKDGLSYLDMKNDTLLSYMIDLCNIILRKVRGDTISGHASVERSVYYRVILEKIKAIDQRLAYQLNKVITMPEGGESDERGVNIKNLDIDIGSADDGDEVEEESSDDIREKNKRTSHDPKDSDPYNETDNDDQDDDDDEESEFDGSVDEDEEDRLSDDELEDPLDEDDAETRKSSRSRPKDQRVNSSGGAPKKPVGVYKPPKLRSVAYNDERDSKSGKRRRDYSEIYQDDDGDQDIVDESYVEQDKERTRYEEENYTRLPDTNPKKAKRKLRAKEMASKGKKKFKGKKGKGGKW